ncbi:NACHT domain-containing protein [Saccharopolyspora sp. HNM0986]|uniref:NACHT domain-containing protein n=1 Tax=Saccharopolyspora galaxeae TaxID=2781241 RepID=UPI00190DF87F|nr:NACHT domain-containing protein [Saccharopolyspora sp. HNM0986]MBK0865469.1 NACHT domain-containing protein [Saccharopolyspora sp. HNM0986]
MAGDNETHNDLSGRVGGNSVQFGISQGPTSISFGSPERRSLDEEQERLLRSLAGQVRSASDRELGKWGIRDWDALPVRWHTAADNLFDRPEKIYGSAEPVPLDGRFTEILDTYEAVPSRRLVILGEAGAGKTVLAHRLILGLLKKRETEHAGPVPVLFSLGGWNPTETELPQWLTQQLVQDFPYLEARDATTRAKQAELLIEGGFVLPVLDGFDEVPERHHSGAIKRIGTLDLPLIVTSRPNAYAVAARGIKAVSGAAAITLEPLTLDEARDYLCHTTSKDRAPAWDEVFERLAAEPDESVSQDLASVLTTPLMVVLARTVYNDETGRTPLDLLASQRFPTKTVVEDHLLDEYLTTVYAHPDTGVGRSRTPNWDPARVRHWLGYLATHLQRRDTHDLTWWHLHTTLHRRTRVLITAAIVALTVGFTTGLAKGLVDGFAQGLTYGLMDGLTLGLAVGFVVGLVNEVRFSRGRTRKPERLRLSMRRRGGQSRDGWMTYLKISTFEFTVGLTVGLTYGLAERITNGLTAWQLDVTTNGLTVWLTYGFTYGLTYGLTLGLILGFPSIVVVALGDTSDPHTTSTWTLLTRDRTVTLIGMAMAMVFVAVLAGPFGFLMRIVILIPLIRLALSAWGRWLLFARLWLPLTGRLPWRPKRFLEDANVLGVLRTAGAVYQFRHARLRDHLAERYRKLSTRRLS